MVEIQSNGIKLLFCCIYRHGNCQDAETNEVFNRIIEVGADQHVIVCGHFNGNAFDPKKYTKLHV